MRGPQSNPPSTTHKPSLGKSPFWKKKKKPSHLSFSDQPWMFHVVLYKESFKDLSIFLLGVQCFFHMYVCIPHPSWCLGGVWHVEARERASDPLELKVIRSSYGYGSKLARGC